MSPLTPEQKNRKRTTADITCLYRNRKFSHATQCATNKICRSMRTLCAFTILALFVAAAPREASAQNLLITNARIIVGNGQVIEQGSIVVRNGRIASVAAGAATAPGVQTVDARGMTVMPGFIDGHRHIIQGNADQYFKTNAAARMQEFLEAGYTTLMEGGGQIPGITQLRDMVEKGQLKGPRIITSGRADPDNFKTPELARARVQELAKGGVEIIKARIDPKPTPEQVAI